MVLLLGFFSGPTSNPIRFCFGFTSDANNLVWSTYGCDIFVNYVSNGQLFVDYSSIFYNVYEFLELDAPICSPNVFNQYFDPYISLGLEQ